MTILEAQYTYGVQEYKASQGDNLTQLCYKIYKSYDDIYYRILLTLNNRYDWYDIPAGTSIRYIHSSYVSQISEL